MAIFTAANGILRAKHADVNSWTAPKSTSRKIVTGSPTAATEYFKGKTSEKLTAAFQPVAAQTLNEVRVTRQYKELMGRKCSGG
jgi:hypothetical protein